MCFGGSFEVAVGRIWHIPGLDLTKRGPEKRVFCQ